MKVAIVHYWFVGMRGGEKVVEALCRMYPQADIFTHVVDRDRLSRALQAHDVRTTFIGRLPGAVRHYKKYLPLMPLALEQLDLRGYDLVISSESGPAKGVLTRADTAHVCYCHSPMRYLWDFYQDYLQEAGWFVRGMMRPWFHYLRMWDALSAMRVDRYVANSRTVAARIRKHWRRDAVVVTPPVDVDAFAPARATPTRPAEGAPYLCLGQLVGYKRVDLAVRACTATNRPLVVAGDGEMRRALEAMAGPTVRFAGRLDDAAMRTIYARSRALLFPGEEDFGMVPVEAMASGRPVIAYGRGGALETVVDGETGLFFGTQDADALVAAMDRFEREEHRFHPARIAGHARNFGEARFRMEFGAVIDEALRDLAEPGARQAADR
ncbi:glycosyltransferase [Nitratidesulfovibrio sp. 1201_IL3209]|uniref:glycosyltransferase n=1 Tax=Nitratidesulfovibrio sp. 1201_IL3209 TaxID=3084053 RepID=UPI002FD94321